MTNHRPRTATRLGLLLATFWCRLPLAAAPSGDGLLPNPGFEQGMEGWEFRPGDESLVSFVADADAHGTVLELHPDGKLLGVETKRLRIGQVLKPDQAYRVEAGLKNDGLTGGVFAFSMYCYNAEGKSLKQIVFYSLSTKSKPHDWRRQTGEFGPGTSNPLPAGTESVCLRFSFYEANRNCQGKVSVDNVVLQPYDPPAHEGWPHEIVADVGDLQIRFERRSFWTLYRIDYKGDRLCLDRWGSHYGSVVSFPGVGFIGSGHTENEDEQVESVTLFVDGKPVERPKSTVKCEEIRLHKKSRIRDFVLTTDISVKANCITEEVTLTTDEPTRVNLIYHFMHPWTPTATEYIAELPDGTRVGGEFTGDKRQKIDKPTRWSAIYDAPTGKGAVTYVLAAPEDDNWRTRYWDVPDRYRKHYFTTFPGKTVPAGKEFHYRVVTVPFEAARERWKEQAVQVVELCAGS